MLVLLKDPRSRVILIVPAIFQTLVFGYVASFDLNRVSYALLDLDRSHSSMELIARFDGAGIFERRYTLGNSTQIKEILDEKKAVLVLSIASGFEKALKSGQTVPVQVLVDGRNGNVAGIASGYASTIINDYNRIEREKREGNSTAVQVSTRSWYNPNLETRWNFVSGMVVILSMVQVLILSSLTVSREREQGTFDQLLVTPYTPTIIMVGKSAPMLCVGMFQSCLVLIIALTWFRIPFSGSYFLFFSGLALLNLAVAGVGLCISSLTSTMQQSMLYAFSLIITLMLLSGFITPISSMPDWLQMATWANPIRHGVEIAQRIYLQGAGIEELYLPFLIMMAIACATLGAASRLFRKNS